MSGSVVIGDGVKTIGLGHADIGDRQPTSSAPRIGTTDIEGTTARTFTVGIIGVTVAN
jgi:hypothetical protein